MILSKINHCHCQKSLFFTLKPHFLTLFLSAFLSSTWCLPAAAESGLIDIVDRTQAEVIIQGKKDDIPLIDQETEESIDKKQEQLSEALINAATWVDSFFDNKSRALAEQNYSRAILKLSAGIEEQGDFQFKPRLNLRLHLPGIEDRLNFLLSANSDEDFDADRVGNNLNSRESESSLVGAFRFFAKQTEKINIATSVGLSSSYAYAGVRYRGFYDYGSWQGRFITRLRYYTDDGFELRNQYDIERQIAKKFLFRTTVEANLEEKHNGMPHALTFSLFQVLGPDRAILYDFGNFMTTSPSYQLVDTVFRLRYRQRFYRDWLVVELAPQLAFPKEYDRDPTLGLILKLEADFGYKNYKEQFNNIFSF